MSESGGPLSADQVDAYLAWSRSAVETGGHPNVTLSCRIDGEEFSTVAAARRLAEAAADEPDVLAWLAVSLVNAWLTTGGATSPMSWGKPPLSPRRFGACSRAAGSTTRSRRNSPTVS